MRPSPSNAASCVLMSAEICAADTPITAGPIASSTRRTPSSRQSSRARQHADREQRPDLHSELRDAADEHAPGERHDRRIEVRREKDRGADDRQVEQHRRERGNREPPVDVEHAAGERHQRHEQDVRKDDADHLAPSARPCRASARTRRRARRRATARRATPSDRQHQQHDASSVPTLPTSARVASIAALAAVLGEYRNERLRERAFGEQAAQDVRQPERRLEGVHLHARRRTPSP